MTDGGVRGAGRQYRSGWWTAVRALGVMWLCFGGALLGVLMVLGDAFERPAPVYFISVALLWVVGGAALLLVQVRVPRLVEADVVGLRLDRGHVRSIEWRDVLRIQSMLGGWSLQDVWVETRDNRLVRLPAGLDAGTIEGWRTGLGAPAGDGSPQARDTWARAPLGPAGEGNLAQLLLWPYLLSSLLAGDSVLVLGISGAVGAAAAAALLLTPRAPVVASENGITLSRRLRRQTVPWTEVAAVRRGRGGTYVPFALVRSDGSTVALPPGLTPDVVDGWQRTHAPAP